MQVCVRPGVGQEELVGLSLVSRLLAVNVPSVGVMSTMPLSILYIKVTFSRRACSCSLLTSSVALVQLSHLYNMM